MVSGRTRKNRATESKYERIKINIFPLEKPDFKNITEPKDEIIRTWLKQWLEKSLANKIVKVNQLLPLKADLAYYFGVGAGTVQNAIRKLEDEKIVASKQKIGTLIIDKSNTEADVNKLTSKRDKTIELIKKYIIDNNLMVGDLLPTYKELEENLAIKRNTIRVAIDALILKGFINDIIDEDGSKRFVLNKEINSADIKNENTLVADTLAQKVSADMEKYIVDNCKIGDRINSINEWAKHFKVSDKTAHEALQILFEKGIIQTRRGRYGTIVCALPNKNGSVTRKEDSIFMSAEDAQVYSYKRIENYLKNKIKTQYAVGQKLPSMKSLSEEMDVSTNTIRKAILMLANDGYVSLSRGRFGGIYVLDIPQDENQTFRWLAVNPQYVQSYKN